MSTPGGAPERVPSTVKVDKTTGAGKPPAGASAGGGKPTAKTPAAKPGAGKPGGAKPGAGRPAGKGGKGRKPITPVKVSGGRNWGPIAVIGVVLLIAGGIIAYASYGAIRGSRPWQERAADIKGIVDYRKKYPELEKQAQHKQGVLTYPVTPPVGGDHNAVWQNCMGDVYPAPVPKENAVHSLEHGAVWVTYKPGLAADQIATLTKKVEGKPFTLMSPYTGLDANISLQAWGFQLKVDSADDARIDEFIRTLRQNTTREPGAACSGGNSSPGDAPASGAGMQAGG